MPSWHGQDEGPYSQLNLVAWIANQSGLHEACHFFICSPSHHRKSMAQGPYLKVGPDAGPQPTRISTTIYNSQEDKKFQHDRTAQLH